MTDTKSTANDFKAFMTAPAIDSMELSYVASDRFIGADKKPVPWKFKPIDAQENNALLEECTKKFIGPDGKQETKTDFLEYQYLLCTKCVTFPDLNNASLQEHYGAIGAKQLLQKMLLPGEVTDLYKAISEALGFANNMKDKIHIAKN